MTDDSLSVPPKPGSSFDEVAALYDRARPGYPERLVDEVLAFTQVRPGGRVLEIGCGTGQASILFASRGLRIVCLEPGPNLARLARKRLASFDDIEVRCESFESWPMEREGFDLIISAKAFHWVPPRVRFVKAAQALRPGGVLAIFQNSPLPGQSPVHTAIRHASGHHAHIILTRDRGPREKGFARSPHFGPLAKRSFEWSHEYDAETYVELLQTRNRVRLIPAQERSDLLVAVHAAIEKHGGRISVQYATHLLMARRERIAAWWRRLASTLKRNTH